MPFPDEQLQFVVWISQLRNPFLDPIFRFLNYLDTEYFFFFLIPLIWFGISYKWGLKIYSILFVNNLAIHALKNSFNWTRPNQDMPGLGLFDFASHGFPSGGAQTSALLASLLIYYWKSRWAWPIGIFYAFLLGFSRIYLGVHYPIDVLGGWTFGCGIFFLYLLTRDSIEKFLDRIGPFFFVLLTEIFLFALFFTIESSKARGLLVSTMAIGVGAYLTFKYQLSLPAPTHFLKRCLRAGFAIFSVFLLYLFWPKDFAPLTLHFIIGLWISLGFSPIWKWIERQISGFIVS